MMSIINKNRLFNILLLIVTFNQESIASPVYNGHGYAPQVDNGCDCEQSYVYGPCVDECSTMTLADRLQKTDREPLVNMSPSAVGNMNIYYDERDDESTSFEGSDFIENGQSNKAMQWMTHNSPPSTKQLPVSSTLPSTTIESPTSTHSLNTIDPLSPYGRLYYRLRKIFSASTN